MKTIPQQELQSSMVTTSGTVASGSASQLNQLESLGLFFEELGIIVGRIPVDALWDELNPIGTKELDELVISLSVRHVEQFPNGVSKMLYDDLTPFKLFLFVTIGNYPTMPSPPCFVTEDGSIFTFLRARFQSNTFVLETVIERAHCNKTNCEFSIRKLREILTRQKIRRLNNCPNRCTQLLLF